MMTTKQEALANADLMPPDSHKGVLARELRASEAECASLREKKDDLFLSHQIAEVRRENDALRAKLEEAEKREVEYLDVTHRLESRLASLQSRYDKLMGAAREALMEAQDLIDDTSEELLSRVSVERRDGVWDQINKALSLIPAEVGSTPAEECWLEHGGNPCPSCKPAEEKRS
jgi:chromosome segregation ATPase